MVLGLWDFLFCVLGLGRLPLEGKTIYIKRRSRHLSYFSCKRGFHLKPRDGTPQRLIHKFESRDEWPVARD